MRTLLLVCLSAAIWAQSQAPPPAPGVITEDQQKKGAYKQTKHTQNENVSKPSPVVANEPSAASKTHGVGPESTKADKAAPPDNSPNIPNLLLAFFSGALALVAYLQWRSMERQVIIMERQTGIIDGSLRVAQNSLVSLRQYVGLTEKLAESARASADTATQALHLTERADILVSAAGMHEGPNFHSESIPCITFRNYGRTRGDRVDITCHMIVPDQTSSAERSIPSAVLGAGAAQTVSFDKMSCWMKQETFLGICAGETQLRFEAEVTYFDVFGKRHRAKASGIFIPETCGFRMDANQEAD
jgi:hypothetical protein